jgi:hypothetical protein
MEIAARIDSGPAAAHASWPHKKIIASILRHGPTIFIGQAPCKSRDGRSQQIAFVRTKSHKLAESSELKSASAIAWSVELPRQTRKSASRPLLKIVRRQSQPF